jgi:hypothetical protein
MSKPCPPFIKDILEDEEKLTAIINDVYTSKELFNDKNICLLEDGIFE